MIKGNIYYQKAIDFIQNNDLAALPTGTHVIEEGKIWVNIVEAELRPADKALLEAHDEFIDIHIPFSGPESYGVKKRADCTSPRGPMDKTDDIIFFDDKIEELITGEAGQMTVFEPDMAHSPMIGEGHIHKAIFKVKASQ